MIRKFSKSSFLFALAVLIGSVNAQAAVAGKFIFVHGKVTVTDLANRTEPARRGMDLNEGDTVVTGPQGNAQVRMSDGAMIAVRPETQLRVEEYAYREADRKESGVFKLLKGTFRSVTGAIGHNDKDAYKVLTPVATIGIRGTDHEPLYVPPGTPGTVQPGAYDKVNYGATYLETQAGVVEIGPNQVGFAGAPDQPPTRLSAMPDVYTKPVESGSGETEEEGDAAASDEQASGEQQAAASGEEDSGDAAGEGSGETTASGDGTAGAGSTEPASETTTAATSETTQLQSIEVTDGGNTVDLTNNTVTDSGGTQSDIGDVTVLPRDAGMGGSAAAVTRYTDPYSGDSYPARWMGSGFEEELMLDGSDRLYGFNWDWSSELDSGNETIKVVGPVSSTHGYAGDYALTGIHFGSYSGGELQWDSHGSYDGTPYDESWSEDLVSYHWVVAPLPTPEYMPQVFKGTISYQLDGGTAPTDLNGNTGTLNSASVTADFTHQTVAMDMSATVGGHQWAASATGMPMSWESFWTYDGSPTAPLTVTFDGQEAWGGVNGGFGGEGLSGAYFTYELGYWDANNFEDYGIVGAAALSSGEAQSTDIDHRVVIWSGLDGADLAVPLVEPPPYKPGFEPVGGAYNNAADITVASGAVTGFRSEGIEYEYGELPIELSYSGTVADAGTDPVTGIMWGRWEDPSTVAVTDLKGNTIASGVSNQLHYLAGPEMNQPVALPTSGQYNYAFVGGTTPTDNHGNVGTAPAASDFGFSADFTHMTVDASVSASVNGVSMQGVANDVALEGVHFGAGTYEMAPLTVTCSVGCGSGEQQMGMLVGGFTGPTGEGAGLSYSLRSTDFNTVDNVISGVAAFSRQ